MLGTSKERGTRKRSAVAAIVKVYPPSKKLQKKNLLTDHNIADQKDYQDEAHLLGIFPTEIWLKILDFIPVKTTHDAVNDLGNISNAASYFRQLLLPKRILFLFADMLTILKHQTIDEESGGKDVHRCREVCVSWNRSMVEYYRLHPARRNLIDIPGRTLPCDDLGTVEFSTLQHVQDFLNFVEPDLHIRRNMLNPFPYGFVRIKFTQAHNLSPEDLWDILSNYLYRLIEPFERHVLYCHIVMPRVFGSRATLPDLYRFLVRLLETLKNLQTLEISYNKVDQLPEDIERQEANFFAEAVQLRAIPTMKELQCLKTSYVPACLFNAILRRNTHVRNVHVVGVPSVFFQKVEVNLSSVLCDS